jgi:putative transposase
MENKLQPRKSLRLKGFDYTSKAYVYFVTTCTADKQPYFLDSRMAKMIEDGMEFRRAKKEIKLYCYCIMPDHLHRLLSLTDSFQKSLQDWVSAFKRYTTKASYEVYNIKPLWQKNFYDHIAGGEKSIHEITQYILNNPVRKGIVSNWESYPYSRLMDSLPI